MLLSRYRPERSFHRYWRWLHPDDDIDARDPHATGGDRQIDHGDAVAGDILELTGAFEEEVMVVGDVGVEVGPPGLDHDLAQQTRGGELVQRVVDRGQGHPDAGRHGLAMKLLGRDVPVAAVEQQAGKGEALARRPQAGLMQPVEGNLVRAGSGHGLHMGTAIPKVKGPRRAGREIWNESRARRKSCHNLYSAVLI